MTAPEDRESRLTESEDQRLDPSTASELYALYSGDLKPFLLGLLRDGHLAEEAVQNTFQQALRKGANVNQESWKPWLFQVAYNEAMALRRREKIDFKALQIIARTAPRHGLPADRNLIDHEERERLRQTVEQLPHDQRLIVQKRVSTEQTFQQIADELNIPLGTVLTRMRLALDKLRKSLNTDRD